MIRELQDFGLSENEARVYYAALEIGRATADQLSKQAKVKRPTTYVQIDALMEKGLMSKYEEGKKTYFVPESPEYLQRIFDRKKQELAQKANELTESLPNLVRLFRSAGDKPEVRFYEGKEGIITIREEMLQVSSKEHKVFFAADNMTQLFTEEEMVSYTARRIEGGINTKILYTRENGPFKMQVPNLMERRFIQDPTICIGVDVAFYDNSVAFLSLTNHVFGVVITSSDIVTTLTSLFEFVWNTTKADE